MYWVICFIVNEEVVVISGLTAPVKIIVDVDVAIVKTL